MSDLASEIREVAVTLPDGAVRRYPAGTTAAADRLRHLEVARQGRARRPHRRPARRPVAADRAGRRRSPSSPPRTRPRRSELIRHDAAHIMAEAVQELCPEYAGHHRPGDRERLLLRLRPRRAVHARTTSATIEEQMREIVAARDPIRTRGLGPRRGDPPLRGHGRELQGRAGRGDPRGRPDHGSTGRATGRTSAAARTSPTPARCGKAFKLTKMAGAYWRGDQPQRRCCSASTARPSATRGGPRRLPPPHGGGREARPPQARPRAWTSSTCRRRRRGSVFWHPKGLDALAHARGLHPPPARRRRLRRGEDAAAAGPRRSGSSPATGASSARTCSWSPTRSRHRRGRADPLGKAI